MRKWSAEDWDRLEDGQKIDMSEFEWEDEPGPTCCA